MSNQQWLTSVGRIVYDPHRPGLKKKPDNWVILQTDPEICRYYRWWVDKHVLNPLGFDKNGLSQPSWGAHVSIIRGLADMRHCPFDWRSQWKFRDREVVPFQYRAVPRFSGDTTGGDRPDNYWFVDVRCAVATSIREFYRLKTTWGFHMTIGRTW